MGCVFTAEWFYRILNSRVRARRLRQGLVMSGLYYFTNEHTQCPFQGKTQHPGGNAGSGTQIEQDGAVRVKEREGLGECVGIEKADLQKQKVTSF